ncbi:MAG: hypothetical protein K2K14_06880, partial [Ruminococcus sp.]|nr:hypothetical protein [Ruminococcus sp.]
AGQQDAAEEFSGLQKINQNKSGKAGSSSELLMEREKNFSEILEKLRIHMTKVIPDVPETINLNQAEKIISGWKSDIRAEGEILQKNADILKKAEKVLKDSAEEKKSLNADIEQAFSRVSEIKAGLTGSQSVLKELEQSRDYPTAEDAENAFVSAQTIKNEKTEIYADISRKLVTAKQQKDNSRILSEMYIN